MLRISPKGGKYVHTAVCECIMCGGIAAYARRCTPTGHIMLLLHNNVLWSNAHRYYYTCYSLSPHLWLILLRPSTTLLLLYDDGGILLILQRHYSHHHPCNNSLVSYIGSTIITEYVETSNSTGVLPGELICIEEPGTEHLYLVSPPVSFESFLHWQRMVVGRIGDLIIIVYLLLLLHYYTTTPVYPPRRRGNHQLGLLGLYLVYKPIEFLSKRAIKKRRSTMKP